MTTQRHDDEELALMLPATREEAIADTLATARALRKSGPRTWQHKLALRYVRSVRQLMTAKDWLTAYMYA